MRHRNTVIEKTDGSALAPQHHSLIGFFSMCAGTPLSDQPITTLARTI
jgi:hypothetical protein